MKTIKTILLGVMGILTLFATVSCAEASILDDLLKATGNIETVAVTYSQESLTDADGVASEVAYIEYEYEVMLLAETDDNPLITFNELRLELIALHEELIGVREEIRTYAESIRTSVSALKEMEYILLEEDKDFIISQIDLLKEMRAQILATEGEAYQRIYELRGTYTRENLPNIINVYQEVKEVLEYRLEILQNSITIFEGIDNLLKEYLES